MREMPQEFSRKWMNLWYSGAIDQRHVYLRYLVKECEARHCTEDLTYLKAGIYLRDYSAGYLRVYDPSPRFVDILHVTRMKLPGIRDKIYLELTTKILGMTIFDYSLRYVWRHTSERD